MRTTPVLDDDLSGAARALAAERRVSIGRVISELARKGMEASRRHETRDGFPVFSVPAGAQVITIEDVKKIEDEL